MVLKACILAHGYKLEEASRRDVASRVWRKGSPKNPHRKGNKGEPERGKGTQEEQVTRQQDVAEEFFVRRDWSEKHRLLELQLS